MLSLVEDKVITVRMTLARVLISLPSKVSADPDILKGMQKLTKDRCGDIRDLVSGTYIELVQAAKLM